MAEDTGQRLAVEQDVEMSVEVPSEPETTSQQPPKRCREVDMSATLERKRPCPDQYVASTTDPAEAQCPAISVLPQSLLIKIFSYLQMSDILLRVNLVCREWHDLASDPELWRVIDMKGLLKVTDEVLFHMATLSQTVSHIDLSDSRVISDKGIIDVTKACQQLKTLVLIR